MLQGWQHKFCGYQVRRCLDHDLQELQCIRSAHECQFTWQNLRASSLSIAQSYPCRLIHPLHVSLI